MSISIRARLTAWYCLLLTAVLAGVGGFILLQLRADLQRALDGEGRRVSRVIEQHVRGSVGGEAVQEEFTEAAHTVLSGRGGEVQLLDGAGRVLAHHGADAGGPALVPEVERVAAQTRGQVGPQTVQLRADGGRYRLLARGFSHEGRQFVLVVALSSGWAEETVARVQRLLVIAGPTVLLATALAAYWLAYQALRPVERMTADAEGIETGRLDRRVAQPASHDELSRLARTLNAMLARIEEGVLQRRRLVADTSHELRTPLAVMRAELDLSLRSEDLPAAAREVLASARDEVDRMNRTVDNLLTLAEVEQARLELLTQRVDLRAACEQAARPLQPLAALKDVRLEVAGERHEAQADPRRLLLALTNLVENAVKYTPPGGSVQVQTWQQDGEVGVRVLDDGPGIAPDEGPQLFERFYRGPGAGSGENEGSGLGLAICREVATAHDGRLWVEARPGGGSAFSLALPGWRSLPPLSGGPPPLTPGPRTAPDGTARPATETAPP